MPLFSLAEKPSPNDYWLKLLSRNLVALVGPLGSGKSSIINAGLLPLLRRQGSPKIQPVRRTVQSHIQNPKSKIQNGKPSPSPPATNPSINWPLRSISYWSPLYRQADRLIETRQLGDQLAKVRARLEQVVEHALTLNGEIDRLLLVVDQFEELVTLTPDAGAPSLCRSLAASSGTA